jgi:murein L,D-transpeptidase YcbB/YkuD
MSKPTFIRIDRRGRKLCLPAERGAEGGQPRAWRLWVLAIALGIAILTPEAARPEGEPLSGQVAESLRSHIEAAASDHLLQVGGEAIAASPALLSFYEGRAFRPAWSGDRGPLPVARELLAVLADAQSEGLQPATYGVPEIQRTLKDLSSLDERSGERRTRRLAEFDLLLTDGFLRFAQHMLHGRVRPDTLYMQSRAIPKEDDVLEVLNGALESGRIAPSLSALSPSQPGYASLRSALAHYRELAARGGYPLVPSGPKLVPGDRDRRVRTLRRRLTLSGDLHSSAAADPLVFDAQLAGAVRRFQRRHGLLVDGVVGAATTRALNVPALDRVREIELNMERWRWLPRNLGDRYILVNIPAFELELVDSRKQVMRMKVIVGKPYLSTPVFSAKMTYLVLNPRWSVPRSIATKEILPTIRRDPAYLSREGIRVFHGSGPDRHEVDPQYIDWHEMSSNHFPFHLRQDPGPKNPLGRVKFMFPNMFDVYLHDTPSRQLFSRPVRGFSHGCIRIEKALNLAEYLLKDDPRWDAEKLTRATDFGKERTVPLRQPISVEIVYFTAWVDEDGTVNFRDDIYGRNQELAEALAKNGY